MSRPSGLTLLTCALLVLMPALAVLQYRWVGQVSIAERERMQRNLRNAALQFRESFDVEVARAFLSLQVGPATARDGSSERYSDRYDTWADTAEHPQIVSAVYLVDADAGGVRLRQWDPAAHVFAPAAWPEALAEWQPQFERERIDFDAGRAFDRRQLFPANDSLLVAPLRNLVTPPRPGPGPQSVTPVFGFTVMQLDLRYIQEQVLPLLAKRHFMHTEGDVYRVAVTAVDDPRRVIYQSDQLAPVDPAHADATESLLGQSRGPGFLFARGGPGDPRRGFGGGPADRIIGAGAGDAPGRGRPGDEFGRWRLLVQHQSGSLEAAVAMVRRRNLAISFGVLLLLTISIGLLTATSRRAHRLARQQMEFVASVSHELRTPVAVIRSAAENLSHGVVGSGDRIKRYGEVIGTEARRLGEMVERILQYAGFESGLGLGARAPVQPSELVAEAIESATALEAPQGLTIEREVASDLPPVLGDSAALRSAVQNLVANAIKYGGTDRWVGVRAEVVRSRRRDEIRIAVSDHGDGIPAPELPHIFEPFYRGADAVARQVHGNGLGLSLVRRIVTAHGGHVAVAARPGHTTFTITLPVAATHARTSQVSHGASAAAHS